jgi:hypothetical protein
MDTAEFLRTVLPQNGYYVLAVTRTKMSGYKHEVFETIEDLAAAALKYDQKGWTVYHCCCTVTSKQGVYNEHKKRNQVRVKVNAEAVGAQWLDMDVGPDKEYPSRAAALSSLKKLCREFELPAPVIVSSGVGLQVYWPFLEDYPAASFSAGSRLFSEALKVAGYPHDTKPTRNVVSLLRPIGTHHRKGEPKPVKCVREGVASLTGDEFYSKFGEVQQVSSEAESIMDEWGTGHVVTYAPSSARGIMKRCAALRKFARHTTDMPSVAEDHWRNMLALLKHTVEGEKLAHRWSKQSDARYSYEETQAKMDNWEGGPPTCTTVSTNCDSCETCPFLKKKGSPISLGRSAELPPEPEPEVIEQIALRDDHAKVLQSKLAQYHNIIPSKKTPLPFWNKKYSWDGQFLRVYLKTDDGGGDWVPFCSTLYYPFMRYEKTDGTRALLVCALIDPSKNIWRVFDMDTSKVGDARSLAMELAAQEVTYMKNQQPLNQQFVQDILAGLRASGLETKTYSSFGWHDNGFVLGEEMITKKGSVPVFLSKKVPSELRGGFGTNGTLEGWAKSVDKVYNRPGAEPHQWLILTAAGSVLVHLCESDMWHGIPGAATGESGCGKSTACLVGCSMFGSPSKMMVPANSEGTTMNALIQRTATMRHLPILMDEVTGRKSEELQALLFALSNGRPKKRLRADGSELDFGESWDMMGMITGNTNIIRMLAESDRLRADASQVRVFEIKFTRKENEALFHDINGKADIEKSILAEQYGVVGREFLRRVIKNKVKVVAALHDMRAKLGAASDDQRERFHIDQVACNIVAGMILKDMGAIDFDLGKLKRWAIAHIKAMRNERQLALQTAEDYLQEFIAYLSQHTIITTKFADGRGAALDDSVFEPRFDPYARLATEDKRFIVVRSAFVQWCRKHSQQIDPDWLLERLEREKFIADAKQNDRQRITKGTGLKGVRARCIEFDYDLVSDVGLPTPEQTDP